MKIYIATPITNRPEATMEERLKAAKERVEKIAQYMREERPTKATATRYGRRSIAARST